MKRFLAMLLVLLFVLTALVACGDPEAAPEGSEPETEADATDEVDPTDTEDDAEEPEETDETEETEETKESKPDKEESEKDPEATEEKPTTKPTSKPTKPAATTAPGGTTTDTDEYGQNELVSALPLDELDFDGIEVVKEKVQTGQTLLNMVQQLSQELAMLKGALGMGMPQAQGVPAPNVPNVPQGATMGKAQKNAQMATMTPYGAKLASRANPDMNQQ